MNDNLLLPPNFDQFSDSVIGPVVVTRRSKAICYDECPPQAVSITSKRAGKCTPAPATDEEKDAPRGKLASAESILEVLRWRRRMSQRRYRKKIDDRVTTLENDVDRLREEVERIEMNLHVSTAYPSTTLWKVVTEYFRLFRYGRNVQTSRNLFGDDAQLKFLQETMAPDVTSNQGYGVDALLKDWSSLSLRHESLEVQLARVQYEVQSVIVADVIIFTTINERMLHNALRHDVSVGMGDRWPLAVWKLLGQRLAVPSSVRFCWDESRHQFVSVYFDVDMVTPLMEVFNSLEDASRVLSSSLGINAYQANNDL
ncbi:hypothetical protein ON010_g15796 [Phytophthora cinnamomi]|nr:hypothetical protein ON010_g15796 [Phytophthora cinnamomi]